MTVRGLKIEPRSGTFLTRLFRTVASGRQVRVVDRGEESPYLPGVYQGDVDFMLAEHQRRKHEELKEATVREKVLKVAKAAVEDLVVEPVRWRVDAVKEIIALGRRVAVAAKRRGKRK